MRGLLYLPPTTTPIPACFGLRALNHCGGIPTPSLPSATSFTPSTPSLLVRIHYSALTRSELSWTEITSRPTALPGHDIAGVVHSVHPSAAHLTSLKPGDAVFGLVAFNRDGGAAEYCLAAPEEIVSVGPLLEKEIPWDSLAALPLSGLSAWQALVDHAGLIPEKGANAGKVVLILGATGGVGSIAVQLGVWMGAQVMALSGRSDQLVESLGTQRQVDYTDPEWEHKLGPEYADIILDCVGGLTAKRSWTCLKKGGKFVTIIEPTKAPDGREATFFIVKPEAGQLGKLAELVREGSLRGVVDSVWDLSDGVKAWERCESGRAKGKVVLRVIGGKESGQKRGLLPA